MTKVSTVVFALMLACVPFAEGKAKPEHVPYKIGKYFVTQSPKGYVKTAAVKGSYPVRHPVKTFKFVF